MPWHVCVKLRQLPPVQMLDRLFGPSRALQARIAACRPTLYRVAYAWCHDAALAEDLVHDTLIRGIERAGQLREPDRLAAWLCGILANLWRDHLRARKSTVVLEDVGEERYATEQGPEHAHERAQTVRRVRDAVARLPMGQRLVVTLVDLGELSYAEVAKTLDIPVGTVMSRLCRARMALRAALEAAPHGMAVGAKAGDATRSPAREPSPNVLPLRSRK